MKYIRKHVYYVITILLGISIFCVGSYKVSAFSTNSVITSSNEKLELYINYIIESMKNDKFSSIVNNLVFENSGSNPIYSNINGFGLDGIDRQVKLQYSDEEILVNTKKYVENLFGNNAWTNVSYTIKNTYGPNSKIYWIDQRDGAVLTELEYGERCNDYWNELLIKNNMNPETINYNSTDVISFIDNNNDNLPFKNIREIDPDQFLVTLSFNDVKIAATGEGEFYFIVGKYSDDFKIYQSFQWGCGEENEVRDQTKFVKGILKDNSIELPQQINTLILQLIESIRTDNIDQIVTGIEDHNMIWKPDNNKDYSSINEIVIDQINCYKALAKKSSLDSPKINAIKLDCLNDKNYLGQSWIDIKTNELCSNADAERINNEYIINECLKYGIQYDAKQNGANLTEEELKIINDNKITPGYYPVQPVCSFTNKYILYKISMVFDDIPNVEQKYFSFYISNQNGVFEIISSLYYEPIYKCGISVQNIGD